MTVMKWMMMGGLLAACTVRTPEASGVPAAPDAVAEAQEAPAAPPTPPRRSRTLSSHTPCFGHHPQRWRGTNSLPPHHGCGVGPRNLRSTGAEEVMFETTVEPRKTPQNQYVQLFFWPE